MLSSAQLVATVEKYPEARLTETEITHLWQYIVPHLNQLVTLEEKEVKLIDPGSSGGGSGPDITDVRLVIGGIRKHGAVEIHRQPADWYHHGHQEDPAFNRVILHLCFSNPGRCPTRREDGVMIPRLILGDYLAEIKKILRRRSRGTEDRRLKAVKHDCYRVKITKYRRQKFKHKLLEAGRCWLQYQAGRLRLLPANKRYLQTVIEALGYTANHRQFRALGRRLKPAEFYRHTRKSLTPVEMESWFLGRAGWFYGSSRKNFNSSIERRRRCWKSTWSKAASLVRTENFWSRGGVRPQAYPHRRWLIFGWATRNLATTWREWFLGPLVDRLGASDFRGGLKSELNRMFSFPSQSYWRHHYTFKDCSRETVPAPVGPGWQAQFTVNIIFPALYFFALTRGDKKLRRKVVDEFLDYPPVLENRRTRKFIRQAGFFDFNWRSAAWQQGAVYVYKKFCRRGRCRKCPFSLSTVSKSLF